MACLHTLTLSISSDDCRRLTGRGQLVSEIEEAIRHYASTLPEPVEPPRAPSVTKLDITFLQADFLRAKELGGGMSDLLLSACAEYAESPGKFMAEGGLDVPAWQSDTHAIKFRWKIQADVVQQILPSDGFERANFIRAALRRYVEGHCQHIPIPIPHRRRTFSLEVHTEDLEKLLYLPGGSADSHVTKALTQFLAARSRLDSTAPPKGQLDPRKPAVNFTCTIPESLYTSVDGDLNDLECTTRAAIKAYLRRVKAAA